MGDVGGGGVRCCWFVVDGSFYWVLLIFVGVCGGCCWVWLKGTGIVSGCCGYC